MRSFHDLMLMRRFLFRELHVSDERRLLIDRKLGDWDFSAHDFSDDELMYAACAMLKHAMSVPEVAPWRLTDGTFFVS